MRLVSIQVGKAKEVQFKNQKVQSGIYKYEVQGEVPVGRLGLFGDEQADRKHHGGPDKACYAFSQDAYEQWPLFTTQTPKVNGAFGENLTISSFNENELCIGDIFIIGKCSLQVTYPRIPCSKLNIRFQTSHAVKEFTRYRRPGVYLRVLHEGTIYPGEIVSVKKTEKVNVTVNEVFHIAMKQGFIPELNSRLEQLETMNDELKKWLIGLNTDLSQK